MANLKITELVANTTPALVDIIPHVDDVAGTPTTKKVTLTLVDELFRTGDLAAVETASATVASTVVETTIIGTVSGSLTLPAGYLTAGRCVRLQAWGVVSDTGTPNLTIKAKFGSTVLASTGAVALASGITNLGWKLEALITCRTTGVTGTVFVQGEFTYGTVRLPMATVATVTVDTTGALVINLSAEWGTSSASNTITCTNMIVERLN